MLMTLRTKYRMRRIPALWPQNIPVGKMLHVPPVSRIDVAAEPISRPMISRAVRMSPNVLVCGGPAR